MRKILLTLMALVAVAFCASAQSVQSTVKWRTSVRMSSPTEGIVTVRAIVAEGWHLYGMDMPAGGPKATTLDFSGSRGVRMQGPTGSAPAPVSAHDDAFGMELQWWTGRVAFTQRFKLENAKDARINIKITYMTCNGTNCMPPRTENVSAPVPAYK